MRWNRASRPTWTPSSKPRASKQMNDSARWKDHRRGDCRQRRQRGQFRAGKDKAFNALVGQIMKASKGKANPQQVNGAGQADCLSA